MRSCFKAQIGGRMKRKCQLTFEYFRFFVRRHFRRGLILTMSFLSPEAISMFDRAHTVCKR